MGRVRFQVTPYLLRELIPIPVSAEIVGSNQCEGNIEIVVDDPAVDVPGSDVPLVTPTFKKNVPVEFVGWGAFK